MYVYVYTYAYVYVYVYMYMYMYMYYLSRLVSSPRDALPNVLAGLDCADITEA